MRFLRIPRQLEVIGAHLQAIRTDLRYLIKLINRVLKKGAMQTMILDAIREAVGVLRNGVTGVETGLNEVNTSIGALAQRLGNNPTPEEAAAIATELQQTTERLTSIGASLSGATVQLDSLDPDVPGGAIELEPVDAPPPADPNDPEAPAPPSDEEPPVGDHSVSNSQPPADPNA